MLDIPQEIIEEARLAYNSNLAWFSGGHGMPIASGESVFAAGYYAAMLKSGLCSRANHESDKEEKQDA